jgi:heme/copper-type cytochrome/quinol oxidase subunit 3
VTAAIIPAEVDPGVLPRRRQLVYGSAYVAGACAIAVLTLVGLYLNLRTGHRSGWLGTNNIPLTQPTMQLVTLIMSMFTMQWAVNAIARDARTQSYLALAITGLLGLAFINQTWFLYTQVGLKVRQLEGPYFYAATGAHLAMVVGGLIFVLVSGIRAFSGSMSSRHPDGISAAAVFWHVTAGLYFVVWLGVYVLK